MTKSIRHVIKLGGNLVVTLPKRYTDFYKIKPKNKVVMVTSDKGIFIQPLKRKTRAIDPFSGGGGER